MKPLYNSPPPIAYPIDLACAACGVGKTVLYAALDSGELPAKKWGKRTLILKSDLQKYLSNLEAYAPQAGGKNV